MDDSQHRALVFSAPSGSGKTTIIKQLFARVPGLALSVSATSRPPRPGEVDGVDYHFLSPARCAQLLAEGEFLESEQVYEGLIYGTLHREVRRLWAERKVIVFDVDVRGAMRIKEELRARCLTIFISPPSLEVLGERLRLRGTESEESLAKRLARAEMELSYAPRFERRVVNDNLDRAVDQVENIVRNFLQS